MFGHARTGPERRKGTAHRRDGWTGRVLMPASLLLAGCEGPQSALDPAGRGAEEIALLFWWLVAIAGAIYLLVAALAVYTTRVRPDAHSPMLGRRLIVWGGAVFPTVVLAGVLIRGLALLPALTAPAPADVVIRIAVTGEQYWWRVRYLPAVGGPVELANEVRLPVGAQVEFLLDSPDVIHSFWIPSLAGKMDMVPGRVTRLVVEPTKTGTFRGACAEFCGASHAFMNFYVEVMEPAAFDAWLAHQAAPAAAPAEARARRGRDLFFASGCAACHRVRGTPADGFVGPDLTHVAGRLSLGAGILPNDPEAFLRWIAATEEIKPGVHMPSFGMLPDEELAALVAYLESLE